MQLSFPADKSVDLAFRVGIAGTQTAPTTVAVVLERDGKILTYKAVQQGDEWIAKIENPGAVFSFGEVKLSVNVLINNRLFTPLKSMATIVGDTSDPEPEVQHDVEPMATDVPKDAANEVPHAEIILPAFEAVVEQVVPTPEPVVVKPAETEEDKRQKVRDLLARAKSNLDAKKAEAAPQIRTSILKALDQPLVIVESEKPKKKKAKPADVFSIKKVGIRVI